MLESGTFAGGKERLKHAAELSGKISFTPPLWQWCERQHLLPPSCSFLTTHPKAFHGAICVPCMDTETVGQRHLPGANSSSEAELRVKPSMLLFLRIHHLKAPFKAQRRGKTSASSIKTPGAVHKPIPTESPPFPPISLPAPRGSQTSTISFCTASVSAPPPPEVHWKVGVCLEGRRDGSSLQSRNPRVGKGLQLPPGWGRG